MSEFKQYQIKFRPNFEVTFGKTNSECNMKMTSDSKDGRSSDITYDPTRQIQISSIFTSYAFKN